MAEKHPIGDLSAPEANSLSAGDSDSSRTDVASDYELTGVTLVLVITGLALSIFLMSLDSSIIATGIPRITSEFNSTGDIGWYGSAYSFSMCALQPIAGKLFGSFPMKVMFLGSLAVFELGSLLCALAINSPMLIVGRAIAGSGAAGCFTGAFCLVAVSIPLVKRPFYIGILQSTFGIATIIGPILGGAFTEHATWRWCFWINLPIGAVTILSLLFFFNPPTSDSIKSPPVLSRLQNLDLLGAVLFAPAIIMILLALQWGGTEHAWKSATIIGLFIGGAGLGVVFALWQIRRGDDAMIPPRLISERTMLFSCVSEFFAMGAVYISIYYLPEWFQVIKGASPTKSGLMYLPLALSDVLSATLTGASLKYLGYPNPYMLLGTGLMSIATGLFSTFSLTTPHEHWIPFQVLHGLGVGMTLSMPYVATQTVLKPEDIPVGTSLLQCFQFFGASVNLAIAEAIFDNKLNSRLASWGFDSEEVKKVISAGSAEARSVVSAAQLPGVLDSYNHAITTTFYLGTSVATVAFLLSLGIRWTSVKPKPQPDISIEEPSLSSQ
ncbi:Major facilitator superfamily domain, general substrate transporter [Penicillium expansum]|uniref:Major facilitator superfamily domain, general substrate transporter n=1 Tax=Penicillium expansum TaxID=27334 RepID=A0A0A2KDA5_PENEN|nr:Major facilitator superfamily domain, general substrate transporter [Penicillium expansum]KGO51157.1 Major facilitator superfamily domain, general substrate transporter [Penicillium expansum]KGO65764.1 Major facilitator superfamily domain, general substrate transporter [Penicillium expansum]